ncbi:MAG: LURP-one-related family protein [Clostridia bacterium]|nr:LURP-one-related family protein [Clostridia bacterium]
MKLYIKQKVFSWKDRFTVKDINGNDRYYVEGELFSLGKKLHIYNHKNEEVAMIVQKVFSFLPRYFVYINGVETAQIVKEFTFFRHKYRIEGLNWEVTGDFLAHDYTVSHNEQPIVSISKEWMTWGDSYELDMADGADEIASLAVVLAIDCVMANTGNAAAN